MKPHVPLMSDLPQDRLDINEQPFQNTGIDFLGPISIKLSKKNMGKPGKGKMLWCNFYMDECMHACMHFYMHNFYPHFFNDWNGTKTWKI